MKANNLSKKTSNLRPDPSKTDRRGNTPPIQRYSMKHRGGRGDSLSPSILGDSDDGSGIQKGDKYSKGGDATGGSRSYWQSLAEQRDQQIKELEERLKQEKDAREQAVMRASQVYVGLGKGPNQSWQPAFLVL